MYIAITFKKTLCLMNYRTLIGLQACINFFALLYFDSGNATYLFVRQLFESFNMS